jgi:hypothetical protein
MNGLSSEHDAYLTYGVDAVSAAGEMREREWIDDPTDWSPKDQRKASRVRQ